jgi:hypothetical protein
MLGGQSALPSISETVLVNLSLHLDQLNKARINFKYFGLEPKHENANKFRYDLEGFFPKALRSFSTIDFDSISLSSLIGQMQT